MVTVTMFKCLNFLVNIMNYMLHVFHKKYIILTTNCLLLQYLMYVETLVNAVAS